MPNDVLAGKTNCRLAAEQPSLLPTDARSKQRNTPAHYKDL